MTAQGFTTNNLIEAIRTGRISDVISALENGDDIELPDIHGYGGLPLRTACFEGNLAIVRELLKRGANPNANSCDGPGAPLRLALRRSHHEVADLLRQTGADLTGEPASNPEAGAASSLPLQDEEPTPTLAASEPDNLIEFTSSSIPSGDAPAPSFSESQHGNVIEFSYADSHLPTEDEDALCHLGSATHVLSMDLLFLEENEPSEHAAGTAEMHQQSALPQTEIKAAD